MGSAIGRVRPMKKAEYFDSRKTAISRCGICLILIQASLRSCLPRSATVAGAIIANFGIKMPGGHPKQSLAGVSHAAPRRQGLLGLGVSAKLQWAFGAVSALTLLATVVALLSFQTIEGGLKRVISV